jgi:cold shock CspA family protein
MYFGKIVEWKSEKGYGFLRPTTEIGIGSDDLFFHCSEVRFPITQIEPHITRIEFEIGKHRGKTVARDVRLLSLGVGDGGE